MRITQKYSKLHWSNVWKNWAVRFRPTVNPMWTEIKQILNENMSGWENLDTVYTNQTYIDVYDKIKNRFEPMLNKEFKTTDINEFLI